jgi:hypothetical protein
MLEMMIASGEVSEGFPQLPGIVDEDGSWFVEIDAPWLI